MSNSASFLSRRHIVPRAGERGQIVIRLLLLVCAYVGTGRLGLAVPYIGSNITLVWLPTGIAVAALVRWGWRYWPGIWLGAVLVNLSIGSSWMVAGGISIGNTLGPLATLWILRRLGFHRAFDRQQDVALFGLAAGAGMLLSASGGVLSLWLAGQVPAEMVGSAWQTWWLGDTVGVLLAGPLLLTVGTQSRQVLTGRRTELVIWCLLTVLIAWATFVVNAGQGGRALPLVFLNLPLVVWAALRFGASGASLAALSLSAIATWGTASGRGPFFQSDVHHGLLLLWAFMVSSVLMGLLITALQAERDRAEAVLQRERDRAQQYFGIAGTALVVLHVDRTVGLINQAGCRLLGWPEGDITGRDWFDHFVPGRRRAAVASAFAAMMRGEGAADEYSEGPVLTRHGEERIVSWHHTVLRDGAGNITGTLSSGMDITRRKRAEAEIKTAKERLSSLIEAIPDAICFKDGAGRWLITNGTTQRLFRLHGIDWQGKTDGELGDAWPEFRAISAVCQRDDELTWQAGKLCLFEEHLCDEEGRRQEFEVRKVPIFENDGRRKGLIVIGRNVTEERNALREIEQLSQRNQLLLMAAGEGIYGVDHEERITFINPAALRMLGYRADELIGQASHRLFHGQHADGRPYPDSECPMRLTLADGQPRQGRDEWFIRQDGSGFPVTLTVSPIREQGRLTGAVVTFQDATERKQAEADIHRLAFYDPLTGLANRRLLYDRLRQAFVKSTRQQSHGAVLFIDLDHFKTLNDTLGHDMGDLLLIEVAERLAGAVREEDTVARLGGDEFVVMLEKLGGELLPAAFLAERVAEKIRATLNRPYALKGHEYCSSPSIGVSLFLAEQKTVDELLKHADIALYRAKGAGRNTIRCFDVAGSPDREKRAAEATGLPIV